MLNRNQLHILGFSDSLFANNYELSTKLPHICFLADKDGKSAPIGFKSYKSNRILRSALAGEVISFSHLFDRAATLSAEFIQVYSN